MIRRPPRSTRTDTLFPYTTLFRSDRLEAAAGMAPGSVRIAVVATETPLAMFNLASYTPPHPRLAALTWGAEDLAAAIGATGNKEEGGRWTDPYRLARSLCLYAVASAEIGRAHV